MLAILFTLTGGKLYLGNERFAEMAKAVERACWERWNFCRPGWERDYDRDPHLHEWQVTDARVVRVVDEERRTWEPVESEAT